MTYNEYTLLEEHVKAKDLWANGVNISERSLGNYTVFLYQLYSFYVEVFYDEKKHEIIKLIPFAETGCLEPYLTEIDITCVV
ncbi:MAG TPA: hypothetical protein VF622_01330 [Segetibacter sp.]|jgi:hypothetical protein